MVKTHQIERNYTFTVSRGGSDFKEYTKVESELSTQELDLLTGEILSYIDKSPSAVQEAVYMQLTRQFQHSKPNEFKI